MAEEYPYQDQSIFDPQNFLVMTILQSICALVLIFLGILILEKYKKKKVKEISNLAYMFFLMGISFLSATIPFYFVYVNPYNHFIFGIPITNKNSFWWTNLGFMFMSFSIIFLFRFMNSLFKIQKLTIYRIYLLLILIFIIWNFYQGTFNKENGGSLPLELAVLFLIIGFLPWLMLGFLSIKLFRQVEPSVHRAGVLLIFLSSVCTVISYTMFIIPSLVTLPISGKLFELIYWIFFLFNSILFYIGYILPEWFKKIYFRFNPDMKDK
jgi:hypothetical protein